MNTVYVIIGLGFIAYIYFKRIRPIVRNTKNAKQRNDQINEEIRKSTIDAIAPPKCPSCGGVVTINGSSISPFCSFCGAKLDIDQAVIKQYIEYSEKQRERQHEIDKLLIEERDNKRRYTAGLIVLCLCILLMLVAFIPVILFRN